MSSIAEFRALTLAVAMACPISAHALDLNLNFTGAVSPGSHGATAPYFDCCESETTSFDGQPVAISISLTGQPGHLYVDHFATSWSNTQYNAPFVTSWSGAGFPGTEDLPLYGFHSTVSLNSNGGSIHIFPTLYYQSYTNNYFLLNLAYSLSNPMDISSSFSDDGVTGGGQISAYINQGYDPRFPSFTSSSDLSFNLTSMSQVSSVPEPSVWAALVLGFGVLGAGIRQRRRRLAIA